MDSTSGLARPTSLTTTRSLAAKAPQIKTEGESSVVTADAAIEWITAHHNSDRPLFAVIWFGSPHGPHEAADEDRKLYAGQTVKLQHFYGEITGMDRAFGKLRSSIADLGIRDNTILWYCSDNGALPKIGNTGGARGNKGKVYDGGLLVPAILEWPAKIKQPRTTSMRCNTCDIYPTLLDIVGTNVNGQAPLDGISLLPLIDGSSEERNQSMGFWDYTARGIGTPSRQWMGELLAAQQAGCDLPPHPSSQNAARPSNRALPEGLVSRPCSLDQGRLETASNSGQKQAWD